MAKAMDNIRVAIRVRPLLKRESGCKVSWHVDNNTITQEGKRQSVFIFDSIFDQNTTTVPLYEEFAKPIVLSVMEGFNGTMFAYGQTSSGKTYTMTGDDNAPGIIPHALREVFNYIAQSENREFLLRVSYMEIYNEVITDLLKPHNTNLKIHETPEKEVFVGDLTEEVVTGVEDIVALMKTGESNRHFGCTNMNERSSRSHTIFRMVIESRETSARNSMGGAEVDGAVKVSHLNLVDLAGSERASATGAEGIRLKEGSYINKSLFALGNVINKLSEGECAFVPFRDSKLTRILQTSLGGNAKTAIICAVTPASIDETLSTLQFASRAKTIKNRPEVNEVLDETALLKRYKKEINELKKQYASQEELMKLQQSEKDKLEELIEEHRRMADDQKQKVRDLATMFCTAQSKGKESNKMKRNKRRWTMCPYGTLSKPLPGLDLPQSFDTDYLQPNKRQRAVIGSGGSTSSSEGDFKEETLERFLAAIGEKDEEDHDVSNVSSRSSLRPKTAAVNFNDKDASLAEDVAEERIAELELELKKVTEERDALETDLSEHITSSSEMQGDLFNAKKKLREKQKENRELHDIIDRLQASMEKNNDDGENTWGTGTNEQDGQADISEEVRGVSEGWHEQVAEKEAELVNLRESVAQLQEEVKQSREENRQLVKEHDNVVKEMRQEFEEKLETVIIDLTNKTPGFDQSEERIEQYKNEVSRLQDELSKLTETTASEELFSDNSVLKIQLQQALDAKNTISEQYKALSDDVEDMRRKVAEKVFEYEELLTKNKELLAKVDTLKSPEHGIICNYEESVENGVDFEEFNEMKIVYEACLDENKRLKAETVALASTKEEIVNLRSLLEEKSDIILDYEEKSVDKELKYEEVMADNEELRKKCELLVEECRELTENLTRTKTDGDDSENAIEEMALLRKKVAVSEAKYQEALNENENLQRQVDTVVSESSECNPISDQKEHQIAELRAIVAEKTEICKNLERTVDNKDVEYEKFSTENEELRQRIATLQSECEQVVNLRVLLEEKSDVIRELQDKTKDLMSENEQIRVENNQDICHDLSVALRGDSEPIQDLQSRLVARDIEYEKCLSENEVLLQRIGTLTQECQQANQLNVALNEKCDAIKELEDKLMKRGLEYDESMTENEKLRQEIESLTEETETNGMLDTMLKENEELKQTIAILTEKCDTIQDLESKLTEKDTEYQKCLSENEELKQNIAILTEESEDNSQVNTILKEKCDAIQDLESKLTEKDTEYQKCLSENEELKQNIAILTEESEDNSQVNTILKEKCDAIQDLESKLTEKDTEYQKCLSENEELQQNIAILTEESEDNSQVNTILKEKCDAIQDLENKLTERDIEYEKCLSENQELQQKIAILTEESEDKCQFNTILKEKSDFIHDLEEKLTERNTEYEKCLSENEELRGKIITLTVECEERSQLNTVLKEKCDFIDDLENKLTKRDAVYEKCSSENEELRQKVITLTVDYEDRSRLDAALNEKCDFIFNLEEKLTKIETEYELSSSENEQLRQRIVTLTDECREQKQLEIVLNEKNTVIQNLERNVADIETKYRQAMSENEEIGGKLEEMTSNDVQASEIEEKSVLIQDLKETLADRESKYEEKVLENNDLQSSIDTLVAEARELADSAQEKVGKISNLEASLETERATICSLTVERDNLLGRCNELQADVEAAVESIGESELLRQENAEFRQRCEALRSEVNSLSKANDEVLLKDEQINDLSKQIEELKRKEELVEEEKTEPASRRDEQRRRESIMFKSMLEDIKETCQTDKNNEEQSKLIDELNHTLMVTQEKLEHNLFVIDEKDIEIAEKRAEVEELAEKLRLSQQGLAEQAKNSRDRDVDEIRSLQERLKTSEDVLEKTKVVSKSAVEEITRERDELRIKLDDYDSLLSEEQLREVYNTMQSKDERIEELEKRVEETVNKEQENCLLRMEIEVVRDEMNALTSSRDEADASVEKLKKIIKEQEENIVELQRCSMEKQNGEVSHETESLKQELAENKALLEEYEDEKNRGLQLLQDKNELLDKYEEEIAKLNELVDEKERELSEASEEIRKGKMKVSKIREEHSSVCTSLEIAMKQLSDQSKIVRDGEEFRKDVSLKETGYQKAMTEKVILEKLMEEREAECEELRQRVTMMENEIAMRENSVVTKTNAEDEKYRSEQVAELEKQIAVLKERDEELWQLKQCLTDKEGECEQLKTRVKSLEDELASRDSQKLGDTSIADENSLRERIAKLEKHNKFLRDFDNMRDQECGELKKCIDEMEEEIDGYKDQIDDFEKVKENHCKQIESLTLQITELQSKQREPRGETETPPIMCDQKELDQLKSDLKAKDLELYHVQYDSKKQLEGSENKIKELEKECSKYAMKNNDLKSEIRRLRSVNEEPTVDFANNLKPGKRGDNIGAVGSVALFTLDAKVAQLERKTAELNTSNETLAQKNNALNIANLDLKQKYNEVCQKYQQLKERAQAMMTNQEEPSQLQPRDQNTTSTWTTFKKENSDSTFFNKTASMPSEKASDSVVQNAPMKPSVRKTAKENVPQSEKPDACKTQ